MFAKFPYKKLIYVVLKLVSLMESFKTTNQQIKERAPREPKGDPRGKISAKELKRYE